VDFFFIFCPLFWNITALRRSMSLTQPVKKSEKREFTIVVIESGNETTQRTFTLTRWKLMGALAGIVSILTLLALSFILWTPLSEIIPHTHSFVTDENTLVAEFQKKFLSMTEELNALREYNIQMRSMLGQDISTDDSAFLFKQRSAPEREEAILEKAEEQFILNEPRVSVFGKFPSEPLPAMLEFPLHFPMEGFNSRTFDVQQRHFGLDIVAPEGELITAPADGYVLFSAWTYDNGNMIILQHSGGFTTVYKHNETLLQSSFTSVKRGDAIATLGNTGFLSNGPHLHFEVWKNGMPLNPEQFLLSSSKGTTL
jgi:murein DD-endopeptidase MepM/ murein hydrolase activator NlpD